MTGTFGGRTQVATVPTRTRGFVANPAGFSPLMLPNLIMWMDGAAAGTLHATGTDTDQWDDRSAYGQDFTATLTARPQDGTRTINGVNVVDFDASNDKMGTTWIADPGSTTVTAWLVAVIDTNAANHVLWMNESTGSNEPFIQARTGGVIRLSAGGSNLDSAGGKFTTGVPFIAKFIWKQVSGALIRTTGTADTTGATGNWANTNPGHRSWFAANSGAGASDPIDSAIGELIVYNDEVETANSDAIDTYLENKWSLTA